jgi:hypothetical protein
MSKDTRNLLIIAAGAVLGSIAFVLISGLWDGWLKF